MFFAGPANNLNEMTADAPWGGAGYSFGARQVRKSTLHLIEDVSGMSGNKTNDALVMNECHTV